jgi:hypothetical protein
MRSEIKRKEKYENLNHPEMTKKTPLYVIKLYLDEHYNNKPI